MNSNQKTVLIGGAALLAYSLFRKGAAAANLTFYPEKVKRVTLEGATPVLEIGLGIQNTSNQSFTIKSLSGNAYANNYYVGNVSSFTAQTIKPNSEAVITLRIRLQPIGVVQDIINAIRNGYFTQKLDLQLVANVDNNQVSIPLKYNAG